MVEMGVGYVHRILYHTESVNVWWNRRGPWTALQSQSHREWLTRELW